MTAPDSAAWRGKDRLALLVGIDDYRGEDLNPLKGCVNDIEHLSALLGEKFAFGVVCLYDQQATRQAILEALQQLLDVAREGTQVVFGWSGHGSRIAVGDGNYHETLVPCDSSRIGWDGNKDITDRELYGWVCRITEKKALLTLIIDGCRAGGAVRDLQPRPRGATAETANVRMAKDKSAFLPVEFDRAKVGESGWLPVSQRYTLLAACLSDEYCREVVDPDTQLKRGLFSYHLQKALARQRLALTWRDLFEQVSTAVTLHNSTQHPQLEGRIDRLVFEQEEFPPDFFLPVLARNGEKILLGGGAVHGLGPLSTWLVLPAGSRSSGEEPELGEVLIEKVGATRSEGSVRNESASGAVAAGQRAFEIGRPVERCFRVLLAPSAKSDVTLREMIEKSPFLTLEAGKEAERAEVLLHRIPARKTCSADDPLPQVPKLEVDSWALLGPSGAQLTPPLPATAKGHQAAVVAKLELLARHRFLSLLVHPDEELAITRSIKLEAFRLIENDRSEVLREELLADRPVLKQGTRIAFRITHEHPKALQVTLISLGLSGNINVLYPPPGRFERAPATTKLEIGFRAADAFELGLPEGYPFPGEPELEGADDALLFLFTETATRDLELMNRPGLRTGRRQRRMNPSQLALKMTTGEVLRSDGPADALEDQEAWGLLRWKFFLQA